MIINAAGFDINYNQLGQGKDVLILHGWGCNITLFNGIANELEKKFSSNACRYARSRTFKRTKQKNHGL